jgi:predicted acylesterase/phospholipase RssA
MVALYEEHGAEIFHRPKGQKLLNPLPLLRGKYGAAGLESVLDRYFGDCRLRASLTNVLVTSYEIERRFPFLFRSDYARTRPEYDFAMKQVARATSAAPTYFEPMRVDAAGTAGYYALVDGALYANNPAMCALVEAQRLFADEPKVLVSLGTGSLTRPIPYEQSKRWGLARWAKPVLDIAFDGVSSTVHCQVRELLPRGREHAYHRFQPVLESGVEEMDDASPGNIRRLKLLAEAMIRERAGEIATLAEVLQAASLTPSKQA